MEIELSMERWVRCATKTHERRRRRLDEKGGGVEHVIKVDFRLPTEHVDASGTWYYGERI